MITLTDQTFSPEITRAALPAIVMFYAVWCPRCAMMKPVAEALEHRLEGRFLFYKVDTDASPNISAVYAPDLVPAFVCFRNGRCLGSMCGIIDEALLEQRIQKIFRNS